MRSRYHPDGSVDYEADRMLEILRHADDELARLQRDQAQQLTSHLGHEASTTSKSATATSSHPIAPPTITDFINDPIAELIRSTQPNALTPPMPNSTTPTS